MNTLRELPKYRCHKVVYAWKIKDILAPTSIELEYQITPEEKEYASFGVSREYIEKHKPEVGGYYVVYEDGYASFSPADAFESGYTLIN